MSIEYLRSNSSSVYFNFFICINYSICFTMTIGIGVVIVILRAGDIGPLFVFGMHYQL